MQREMPIPTAMTTTETESRQLILTEVLYLPFTMQEDV